MRRADAVFHGQQPFRIFGGNAEHPRQPAPEHGSRSAQGDGSGHTDDVACADSGGERGGQGAKLAHVAFCRRVRFDGQADGGEQLALREPQPYGHEHVGAQEDGDHGPSPQEVAARLDECAQGFHDVSFRSCPAVAGVQP